MTDDERRKERKPHLDVLKSEHNPDQRETLGQLEKFGWELRFVRHNPERQPVPVIFDVEHAKLAVLDKDGVLDENAFINIRRPAKATRSCSKGARRIRTDQAPICPAE